MAFLYSYSPLYNQYLHCKNAKALVRDLPVSVLFPSHTGGILHAGSPDTLQYPPAFYHYQSVNLPDVENALNHLNFMLPNNCIFIPFMLPYGCIFTNKGGIRLKTFEKIITILISMALFVCLYLTGQSVFRTASRYILQNDFRNAGQYSEDTCQSFSAGGICGSNLKWRFTDGILTISGKGKMKNYKNSHAPWSTFAVTTVKIGEGVTGIGSHAFNCNRTLKHVLLPSTLITVETNAFDRAERLPSIYAAHDNAHFISFSGILFYRNGLHPVISSSVKRCEAFYPFPSAVRQITSGILYFLLYLRTAY